MLNSSLDNELDGVILGSEVMSSVEIVLDSSVEKDVDGTLLSWEVLENCVEPAIVLLASVELSSTVEDVTSMPLVGVLNGSLVERGDSVISWLLKLEVSKALVENPDSVGVEDVSSLLLVPEMLAEVSVALSKLVDSDPVKDEEASDSLVEVSTGL